MRVTWTPERVKEAEELCKTMTAPEAAKIMGVSIPSLYNALTRNGIKTGHQKRLNVKPEAAELLAEEKHVHNGDQWDLTSTTETRITSLEQLVSFCKIDLVEWEIVRWSCNKWEVGAKNAEKNVVVTPLYQVKATMQKRVAVVLARELIRQDMEDMRRHAPKFPKIRREHVGPHLALISIPDAHLGKLAWREEVGQDYDLKIAQQVFKDALLGLLAKSSGYPIDRVCLVLGNDFLNADNFALTTTRGTPQHGDGRFPKVYKAGRELLCWAIEQSLGLAPVDVIMIPGNHDEQSVYTLGDSLECWFRNAQDVRIDNRPSSRKYYEYGRTLLAFDHGDGVKPKALPNVMAAEAPEAWGRSKHRECITGHLHTFRLEEIVGVNVRILPSLCASDKWHHKNGFVGNKRAAMALYYHREHGWVGDSIHYPDVESRAENVFAA